MQDIYRSPMVGKVSSVKKLNSEPFVEYFKSLDELLPEKMFVSAKHVA
jgi:hypothetical protein